MMSDIYMQTILPFQMEFGVSSYSSTRMPELYIQGRVLSVSFLMWSSHESFLYNYFLYYVLYMVLH